MSGTESMNDIEERTLKIYEAIFTGQPEVELEEGTYRIRKTQGGLRNVTIEGIFYIEQNPHKRSQWAKQAQAGHQILWGLKGRAYVLQVIDGEFKRLKDF